MNLTNDNKSDDWRSNQSEKARHVMRTRVLRRSTVFLRVRCNILILLIKLFVVEFVRCNIVRCSIPHCTVLSYKPLLWHYLHFEAQKYISLFLRRSEAFIIGNKCVYTYMYVRMVCVYLCMKVYTFLHTNADQSDVPYHGPGR
jgi:hypothetical protein